MKAREIAKKIAVDRMKADITAEELEPHMIEGDNVTPGKIGKVGDAMTTLVESLTKRWKLDGGTKKKRKR